MVVLDDRTYPAAPEPANRYCRPKYACTVPCGDDDDLHATHPVAMKKALFIAYFLVLHALLATVCITSECIPRIAAAQHLTMPLPEAETIINILRTIHGHQDATVPEGATIFLGDSITMFLATSALAAHSVNYGIGWQRTDQLIESMDLYESMARAARVVVTIGTNDLLQDRSQGIESRYRTILTNIPGQTSIVVSSIPPLGSSLLHERGITVDEVRRVVSGAQAACKADQRCRFVNAYEALTSQEAPVPGVLLADNIHLTTQGYARWLEAMRPAMAARPD